MDTILKVCNQEITPTPKKIIYSDPIEEGIQVIQNKLAEFSVLPTSLLRWIALKIIDGEEKILTSIEKNFSISLLDSVEIQSLRREVLSQLKETELLHEDFKDKIVSSIMKRCEIICKDVCTFQDENHIR